MTYAAPSAWTTITETLWATTSCSSRAILARSAATATFDWASRSLSSRAARSSSARKYACRVRSESPSTQASTNGTVSTTTTTICWVQPPSSSGQRACETAEARRPQASASREAQRFPAAATV